MKEASRKASFPSNQLINKQPTGSSQGELKAMTVHWDQESYLKAYWFAAQAHTDIGKPVPGTNIPYIVQVSFVSLKIMGALATERVENYLPGCKLDDSI